MADYKSEQAWLMDELDLRQGMLDRQERLKVIAECKKDVVLRRHLTNLLKYVPSCAHMSKPQRFNYWSEAYLKGVQGATTVLGKARALMQIHIDF